MHHTAIITPSVDFLNKPIPRLIYDFSATRPSNSNTTQLICIHDIITKLLLRRLPLPFTRIWGTRWWRRRMILNKTGRAGTTTVFLGGDGATGWRKECVRIYKMGDAVCVGYSLVFDLGSLGPSTVTLMALL